jgi:ornithine cyclodeaminase
VLILTEADVRAVLEMRELIDVMARALVQYSARLVQQPLRTVLEIGPERAFFGVMPAYQPDPPALGTKFVTVFHGNAARGLPTHLATITLLDPETGRPLALLDGRYITEARTAAVSAASARAMARPEASTLAILGSGVQARSHLEALALVRELREVRVYSPTREHRERFAREAAGRLGGRTIVRAVESAAEAVRGADLVALVTSSRAPVVERSWIAEGAHICAVGACRPDMREMDSALVVDARLVVDSREAALAEAGDIVIPMAEGRIGPDHIAGELGDVLAGRVAGRTSPREITLFKSLGLAIEDVAAADLAYRRAVAAGLGRDLPL